VSLDLGKLHATISGDNRDLKRALTDSELRMKGFVRDAEGKLRTLSGRFASEGEKAGLGLGNGIDKGMKPGVNRAKQQLKSIDTAAKRIMIGSVLSIAASAAVHLGAALAPTVGIIAGMPAIAFAAGAAVTALMLALGGVGEVIGAGLSGDVEKFEAALAELPPAAQSAVREIVGTFDGLKDSVQQAFFLPVAVAAQGLSAALSGPLKTGLSAVGGSLGGMVAEVVKFAKSGETVEFLNDLFAGVSLGIDKASTGIQPLLRGLADLAGAFIPSFGAAGTSIGDAMTRWGEWMSQIASSGQAVEWFSKAREALSELWSIGGNVVSIFKGLFSAADGSSVLATLDSMTALMADWVNSAEGQEKVAQIFGLISDVASDLGVILPGVLTVISGLADAITAMPGPMQSAVTGLLALGTAWKLLGVTALVNGAKATAAWFTQTNAAGVSRAAQIGAMAAMVGKWIVLGTTAMINGARMAAAWILGMGPIGWIIAAVIAAVALIIFYWDEIVAGLEIAWQWVSDTAVSIWNGILAFFEEWGWLVFAILTGGVSLVVGWIVENWDAIAAKTSEIFGAIGDFFVMIWEWIVSTVDSGVQGVLGAIEWLGELPGKAWDWFMGIFWSAAEAGAELLGWAMGLPGEILSSLGNLASYLWDSGVDLLSGLWNGMKSMAGSIIGWIWGLLEDMGSAVLEFFGIASPSRLMTSYGEFIGQGLADGIRNSVRNVTASAHLMSEAALPALAPTAANSGVTMYAPSAPSAPSFSDADIERLVDALSQRPQTTIVEVDSVEIARANDAGNRQLARRG